MTAQIQLKPSEKVTLTVFQVASVGCLVGLVVEFNSYVGHSQGGGDTASPQGWMVFWGLFLFIAIVGTTYYWRMNWRSKNFGNCSECQTEVVITAVRCPACKAVLDI